MEAIKMTVQSYNMLPANLRKTESGKHYVFLAAKEWRVVQFIK